MDAEFAGHLRYISRWEMSGAERSATGLRAPVTPPHSPDAI